MNKIIKREKMPLACFRDFSVNILENLKFHRKIKENSLNVQKKINMQ